jgi:hypothetical protein
MGLYRNTLCCLAQRTSAVRIPVHMQRLSPTVWRARAHLMKYSTSMGGPKVKDEKEPVPSMQNFDLDGAEKHMKDWFGDHATWDHEKLKALKYGNFSD